MNNMLKNKSTVITLAGIILMTVLVTVKLFKPESLFSGYALIVGIAFFFIVEAVDKTPDNESQVRFNTIISDLKKPQVLLWVLLPIITTVAQIVMGMVFAEEAYRGYVEHVIGRTSLEMDLSNLLNWGLMDIISVLGEEIAFRGFLCGKGRKLFSKPVCLLISAVLFSISHVATGNSTIVLFDLLGIFIDAIMYGWLFYKSENSVITFIPHFLNNILGLLLVKALFA